VFIYYIGELGNRIYAYVPLHQLSLLFKFVSEVISSHVKWSNLGKVDLVVFRLHGYNHKIFPKELAIALLVGNKPMNGEPWLYLINIFIPNIYTLLLSRLQSVWLAR
jgi:hypothetical protein